MSDARSCLDILAELERLCSGLHHEAPPSVPSDLVIGRLLVAVARLSQPKKARTVECPPDYVEIWNNIGISRPAELSNRAIRYLSWETDVAIRPVFQEVALTPERVGARSLQGLVRSVHRRWVSTVNTPSVGNLVVALSNYAKKNALIEKWKQNLGHVLNKDGPARFASDVLRGTATWDKVAEAWGLEADTEFGNEVLIQCIAQSVGARTQVDALQGVAIRFVLPSKHWRPSSFKTCVQQMIVASSRFSPHQSEELKDFIVNDSRLLDPRLPANGPNWVGISDSARDMVIQWLSAEDIQLFFDHVLPKRSDPHGRKPFWLRYKAKVKRSRPLLAGFDEGRWQANAATMGKRNYGRMEHNCNASAFLLDFGRVIVAEFSRVGNAVYVYERRDVPDLNDAFWSQGRFSLSTLKQKDCAIEAMTHTPLWQSKMRTLLAQFGIHPGT